MSVHGGPPGWSARRRPPIFFSCQRVVSRKERVPTRRYVGPMSSARLGPAPGGERMKVLIAGGAGFIGSTVASACLDAGITPVILDNLVTGRAEFTRGRIF